MVKLLHHHRRLSSTSREASASSSEAIFKKLRSRVVYVSNPRPRSYPRFRFRLQKWIRTDKNAPPNPAILAAFNYLNQNSDLKYQLLKPRSVTPVLLPTCILCHVDFVAKNIHVDDAPEEIFFAELTVAEGTHVYSTRLCISLGPMDSISGDRLNGCCYCHKYNNVWHPKGGGFVRGHDESYKTVQDICGRDMNQNDVVSDHEKHLPMPKQVPREPTKESEYSSRHVDNASQYATEVMKFINQTNNKNYEVVKPGFATRVILTEKCSLFHLNFKAKETDPNAPVKLFFAELTTTSGVFSVKCCLELGQRDIESGNLTGDKTNGCYYCHDFNKVRHPTYGGFVRGGDLVYKSEDEFLCSEETQLI
ncbi:hypothetical protein POM88_022482 [Heracleum sosnowskyi]|uniref:DUF3615 domain-containing protein n=1 Tax=Heracleum sosnowskyi TaxID=360622 RepID=A0AAD8IHY0_9APIA|nr:hypothetical protein POM88_022482 [Heracleum sosnowskyi]